MDLNSEDNLILKKSLEDELSKIKNTISVLNSEKTQKESLKESIVTEFNNMKSDFNRNKEKYNNFTNIYGYESMEDVEEPTNISDINKDIDAFMEVISDCKVRIQNFDKENKRINSNILDYTNELAKINVRLVELGHDPNIIYEKKEEIDSESLDKMEKELIYLRKESVEVGNNISKNKEMMSLCEDYKDVFLNHKSLEETEEYVSKLVEEQSKLIEEHNSILIKKQGIEFNIKSLEDKKDDKELEIFDRDIERTNNNMVYQNNELNEMFEEQISLDLMKELYNNGWLKNELIGQVVGGINGIISDICRKYDINVMAKYDSGFNATFYKDGNEVKYGTCSVGQRKMMQLISMVGIISYYKHIYKDINFMFLDEALSSLSESNSNKMVKMLDEYLVDKMGVTIFITHHSYLKSEYFNSKYFLKESSIGGYTEVTIE